MRVTLCFDAGVGTADDVTWTATTQLSFLFFFADMETCWPKKNMRKHKRKTSHRQAAKLN